MTTSIGPRQSTARAEWHQPASASSGYVPFIDGLRAMAVLAVLIHHLDPAWLPGGFAGVDVFFVISGFVVSASVSRWSGGPGRFLAYFYARRMLRIVPALVVCLLATTLASTLFVPTAWLSSSIDSTGSWAFFGVSNLYLALHQESYYSPTAAFNPYTHTWSLGVEEQFYLVFPLLFFAWTRGGRWRQLAIAEFALAAIGSFLHGAFRAKVDPGISFYLITTRFWELAAGVLLFMLLDRLHRIRPDRPPASSLGGMAAWLSLGAIAFTLATATIATFPVAGAVPAVLGVLGVIAFLDRAGPRSLLARGLSSPLAAYVGKRSYSIYLWHWPVIVLMRWTCGNDNLAQVLVAALMALTLGELSYRFIESPIRQARLRHRASRIAIVAAGVVLTTAGWGLSKLIVLERRALSMSTVSRNAESWYPHPAGSSPAAPGCVLRMTDDGNGLATSLTREGCSALSSTRAALFVLGDSHAMAYSTLLSEYVLRTGSFVRLYPNAGCAVASLQSEREGGHCPAQAAVAMADIVARAKPGDVLLLAALRLNRLGTQFAASEDPALWSSMDTPDSQVRRAAAKPELERLLADVSAKGVHIVFDAPKPMFRAPAFRCADRFNASNPICASGLTESKAALEAYRAPVVESLHRIAARVRGATVWDPFPVLCPTDPCRAIVDGQPLFFDGDHLSAHANRLLYPSFAVFIEALTNTKPDTAPGRTHQHLPTSSSRHAVFPPLAP